MLNKEDQELEKAKGHVERNRVPARNVRGCVDGRYEEDSGMLARPGGDFGYVMALLTLNRVRNWGLTSEQIFDIVYDSVTTDTEDSGTFYMHTDEHAEGGHGPLIGCGHVALAISSEHVNRYEVGAEELIPAVERARFLYKNGDRVKIVNLKGKHKEAGVLVVTSREYTVNPYDAETGSMYFVYDKTRDEEFIRDVLLPRVNDKLAKIRVEGPSYEEFKDVADRQMDLTLRILAEGKRVFLVDVDSEKPQVEFSHRVPKI